MFSSSAITCGTPSVDASGGMKASTVMLIDGTVGMYAGADIWVDGVDDGMDSAAAYAAITSLPMRSRYIWCHALANGSMVVMSAIKILDSRVILANDSYVASFMAFLTPV
jgi:hypothetical protein